MSQTAKQLPNIISPPIFHNIETDTLVKDAINEVKGSIIDVLGKKTGNSKTYLDSLLHNAPAFISNAIKGIFQKSVSDKFKEFLEYLSEHPVWSLVLCTAVLFIGFPVLAFAGLATISTIISFVGFLLVQGTLVSMGVAVMGGPILMIFAFVFSILFGISLVVRILQNFGILKQPQVNQLGNNM